MRGQNPRGPCSILGPRAGREPAKFSESCAASELRLVSGLIGRPVASLQVCLSLAFYCDHLVKEEVIGSYLLWPRMFSIGGLVLCHLSEHGHALGPYWWGCF